MVKKKHTIDNHPLTNGSGLIQILVWPCANQFYTDYAKCNLLVSLISIQCV